MNDVRPTHFKYYSHSIFFSMGHIKSCEEKDETLNGAYKSPIIKVFKYRSSYWHYDIDKLIKENRNMDTLELCLCNVDDNTLELIKSRNNAEKKWNKLIFKNITDRPDNFEQILHSFPDISTVVLDYEQPQQTYLIPDIPNLKKITFKFAHDDPRSIDNLALVYELEIARMDNQVQMRTLLNFLHQCPNLKFLRINRISSRVNLNPQDFRILFATLKNLEEFHLDAYSDLFNITAETLEMIKTEGKNLMILKFTIEVEMADEMREKIKIFNDTKVRAFVMGKEIVSTCLEHPLAAFRPRVEPTCVWMK